METIDPHVMINLCPQERRALIEDYAKDVNVDRDTDIVEELASAFQKSTIINTFIAEYFELRIRSQEGVLKPKNLVMAIKNEVRNFLPEIVKVMDEAIPSDESIEKSLKNVFELSGAKRLAFSNKITRRLSTKMGSLWERLANISPYAVNPELEFGGLKITGIDLLVWNKEEKYVEYHQIKTQENTLTGSQRSRSVSELLIHEHPVFSVCFKTNSSWTFSNHERILRLSGEEFWDRIGMDYELLLQYIKQMIQELEAKYIELLQDEDKWTNSQGDMFDGDV